MITKHSVILFLGEPDNPLYLWLKDKEPHLLQTVNNIDAHFISINKIKFIVSYGYRHIIKQSTLNALPDKESAINLHISYLPWNKGADPNFWSFIDDTPKGVSIHYIDKGLDTGDIIVQQELFLNSNNHTLSSSYQLLQTTIQTLLKEHWHDIKHKIIIAQPQHDKGTSHKTSDKKPYLHLLSNGWHTNVKNIMK
jgi:methionyl-tRNA formyltransferase